MNRTILALTTILTVCATNEARAADKLEWKYQRFTAPEAVATSALLLGTGAIILFTSEKPPAWSSTIFLEDPVRDALRGETRSSRSRAAFIGDMTYYASAYTYVVDVVATAWIGRRSGDVAAQMAFINTEAFALTGFLSFLSNATIRRERPYVQTCEGATGETFPDCKLGGKSESFFSGHTGIAATAAGLTCAHHKHLPLYGGGAGDVIACAATIAGAFVTGYTRLVADKHYLFDVVTGAALGFPIGYLVASYHYARPVEARATTWVITPTASATSLGLGVVGLL
jgi:membrane-associated phospholipid phosphatase